MFTSSATLVLIAIYLEQFVLACIVSFLIRTLVKQLADEIKLRERGEARTRVICARDTSRCQLVIIILSRVNILIMEMSEETPFLTAVTQTPFITPFLIFECRASSGRCEVFCV